MRCCPFSAIHLSMPSWRYESKGRYLLYVVFTTFSVITSVFLLSQVYLGQDGVVEVYANTTIHPNSPINSDLLLDQNGGHIYIMTKTTVSPRQIKIL